MPYSVSIHADFGHDAGREHIPLFGGKAAVDLSL
jgi:hypothetical protein